MHDATVTTIWKRLIDETASPLLVHAGTVRGGCRSDPDAESTWQAARLATWEDEGGMISS